MAKDGVRILGPDGQPVRYRTRSKYDFNALHGGSSRFSGPPYDAADLYGQHMAAWTPALWSPDAELNMYRDRIVSRVRDMVRNDGWANGGVTRILDNVVGANLRPVPKPDYRYLAQLSGSAYDHEWSREFAQALDSNWRTWAYDSLGRYCDYTRNQTFGQMMRVAFRHKLIDGDAVAVMQYERDRIGRGRARYATCVQVVDPDRLSNPQLRFDQKHMRGGVKIDDSGAAVAYYIRQAHAGDWFSAVESLHWEEIARETPWGRPIVVHDFDGDRATQHRGGAGIFTPVLQRLKMLIKYDSVELDSAIINSLFAAYIKSPYDHEMVQEAVDDSEQLDFYNQSRREFHKGNGIVFGNSRMPILFPGEDIVSVNANRPSGNFEAFEGAALRHVATALGLSAQQLTNNWADVNYSSARGAMLEAWKTLDRRREDFANGFAAPIRMCWMEESFDVDDLPLPRNPVPFIEARSAYARCRWMGPGKGWMDPVAEKQGAVMGLDAALSTLEDECAEQGLDYEEVLEQRKYELDLFEKYGITPPEWSGVIPIDPNKQMGAPGGSGGSPSKQNKPSKPAKPQPK